jgi:hypothetical protein
VEQFFFGEFVEMGEGLRDNRGVGFGHGGIMPGGWGYVELRLRFGREGASDYFCRPGWERWSWGAGGSPAATGGGFMGCCRHLPHMPGPATVPGPFHLSRLTWSLLRKRTPIRGVVS